FLLPIRAISLDERAVEFLAYRRLRPSYRTAVGTSSSLPSLYHAEFFDRLRDGSWRSAAIAVPLLINLFEPQSVLDVGCGTGVWLSVFREHGVDDILGIDGPWIERRQQEIPEVFFRDCDLTRPVALERTFDLALCLEAAEHLPA